MSPRTWFQLANRADMVWEVSKKKNARKSKTEQNATNISGKQPETEKKTIEDGEKRRLKKFKIVIGGQHQQYTVWKTKIRWNNSIPLRILIPTEEVWCSKVRNVDSRYLYQKVNVISGTRTIYTSNQKSGFVMCWRPLYWWRIDWVKNGDLRSKFYMNRISSSN